MYFHAWNQQTKMLGILCHSLFVSNYFNSELFKKIVPKVNATPLSPATREVASKALNNLGELLPAQAKLAQQVATEPHSGQTADAEQKLVETTKKIEDEIDVLAGALVADALQKEAKQTKEELTKLSGRV